MLNILIAFHICLQSVLQQASSVMSTSDDSNLLTTIQEHYTMAGQLISLTKKQGVSGQSVDPGRTPLEKPAGEKDFRYFFYVNAYSQFI